jgi:hypothetical protein
LGTWHAEVLDNFDVRSLMREVTLDGPDAQQAYHEYMGKVGRSMALQEGYVGARALEHQQAGVLGHLTLEACVRISPALAWSLHLI